MLDVAERVASHLTSTLESKLVTPSKAQQPTIQSNFPPGLTLPPRSTLEQDVNELLSKQRFEEAINKVMHDVTLL